jgi:hypothetical protein
VTNGSFRCQIACQIETHVLEWPQDPLAVQSFIHQVINPTVGRPLTELEPEFEKRELNTASCQLDWKHQFDKVLVPTVYSKVKMARCKLHPKDLLSTMDVPADVKQKIRGSCASIYGLPHSQQDMNAHPSSDFGRTSGEEEGSRCGFN